MKEKADICCSSGIRRVLCLKNCYKEELLDIYNKLKPMGLNKRAVQSVEDVTNPLQNSINEKCARIRSAFIREFDESLAKNYFVTGEVASKKIDSPGVGCLGIIPYFHKPCE